MRGTHPDRIGITAILFAALLFTTAVDIRGLTVTDAVTYTRQTFVVAWTDNCGKQRVCELYKTSAGNYSGTSPHLQYYDDANNLVNIVPGTPNGGAINGSFGSTVHHGASSHKEDGTLTLRFKGDHLAIFDYVQTIDDTIETVTYTFMDGHDYFQWADTADTRLGSMPGDSRGPYMTMNWDGIGGATATNIEYAMNGYFSMPSVTGAFPILYGIWRVDGMIDASHPNGTVDIPFVREQCQGRETGYVQSQTFSQQIAGCPTWSASANMTSHPYGTNINSSGNAWMFDSQMNFYDTGKKMTWGMPYGYMNHTPNNSDVNSRWTGMDGCKNQWGQYSLSIVFDSVAQGGVMRVRDENRAVQSNQVVVTATSNGSLMTTGPVGTLNTLNNQTLVPAGWDHNYRTFWGQAAGQELSLRMDFVPGRTFLNPAFRIRKMDLLPAVTLNSVPLVEGADYYATLYPGTVNEVWVILRRSLSGTNFIDFSAAFTVSSNIVVRDAAVTPSTVTNRMTNVIIISCEASNSSGTIAAVTVDLSSIGGSVDFPLTNSAGSLWRCVYPLSSDTTPGHRSFTLRVWSSSGLINSASAELDVIENFKAIRLKDKLFMVRPNRLSLSGPDAGQPVTIEYIVSSGEKVSFRIFDAAGELVKELKDENSGGQVSWDGKTGSGRPVASGVYLVVMFKDGIRAGAALKMVVVR